MPIPGQRAPSTMPMPGQRAPSAMTLPGRRAPSAMPLPGRRAPSAMPLPGLRAPSAMPLPGLRAPSAMPLPGRRAPSAMPLPGRRRPARCRCRAGGAQLDAVAGPEAPSAMPLPGLRRPARCRCRAGGAQREAKCEPSRASTQVSQKRVIPQGPAGGATRPPGPARPRSVSQRGVRAALSSPRPLARSRRRPLSGCGPGGGAEKEPKTAHPPARAGRETGLRARGALACCRAGGVVRVLPRRWGPVVMRVPTGVGSLRSSTRHLSQG